MFQIGCSLKFKHQKKDKTLFRIKIKKTYIEYLNLLQLKRIPWTQNALKKESDRVLVIVVAVI